MTERYLYILSRVRAQVYRYVLIFALCGIRRITVVYYLGVARRIIAMAYVYAVVFLIVVRIGRAMIPAQYRILRGYCELC